MKDYSLNNYAIPVIGFVAYSGTGKTTLLEKLLPELRNRNIRVATIKHAHHDVDIDKPGKDSYRLREAGASPMLVVSDKRIALVAERDTTNSPDINEILSYLNPDSFDLLLVEGYKSLQYPKMLIHRSDSGKPDDIITDTESVALISDLTEQQIRTQYSYTKPVFNINQPESIVAFIISHIMQEKTL